MGKNGKAPLPVRLNREMAIACATGNAGGTFELVGVATASGGDTRPDGRFWWADGATIGKGGEQAEACRAAVDHLVVFVTQHDAVPAEAVYREACKRRRAKPLDWPRVPLATRLAFETFVACLVPLLRECAALDQAEDRARQAARDAMPPPDRGIFRRTGSKRGVGRGINRRSIMSATVREAAE